MLLRPFFQELGRLCGLAASRPITRPQSDGVAPQPQRRFKVRRTGTRGTGGAFGKQAWR